MQDSPASREFSAAERLSTVREYQATWESTEIPHRTISVPSSARLVEDISASDAFAYAIEEGDMSSPFTGRARFSWVSPRSIWSIDTRDYFSTVRDIDSCIVDVAQDLVVLTELKENNVPKCYLLSLTRGGPHTLAAETQLRGRYILQPGQPTEILASEFAVVGDMLEWTIFGLETEMNVFDWKTGELMWQHNMSEDFGHGIVRQRYDIRCRIIDPSHTYLLLFVKTEMFICDTDHFDPVDDDRDSPSYLCKLGLPLMVRECNVDVVECYVRRSPTSRNSSPHFECTPDLTVLVLRYAVSKRGYNASVIAFIPLSSIRKATHRFLKHDSPSSRVIPWDEWVDFGARVVFLPPGSDSWPSVSTMSSRVVLTFRDSKTTERDAEVLLFDLHPHAHIGAPSTSADLDTTPVLISDSYTPDVAPIFRGSVRSTLPYRVVKKIMPRDRGAVNLIQDGIFTATRLPGGD
ncbi:hypothetical protein C8Q80DRAFT_909252 [Daedaleopsis nitida]|nr:hypothetical protein C8Q80DRAFT_909252 [Daedaleopsis nitida]